MVLFRRVSLAFSIAILWIGLVSQSSALELGAPAPALEAKGQDGQPLRIKPREAVVYLDFWASWCGPCKQSFPWMNAMQTQYGSKGLRVIAINLDQKPADGQRFLQSNRASFEVGWDPTGQTPRLYGVKTMPTSYLIDRQGKVIFKHAGFTTLDEAALEKQIKLALEGPL